jgi:CheY-like chemotaxis protein
MRQVGDKKYEEDLKEQNSVLIKEEKRKYHILLVDDDSLGRTVTAFACENSGFVVSQASSGEQALSMINEGRHKYDLVIVDLESIEMFGLALVSELIKSYPEIPAFVISRLQDKMRFIELLNDNDKKRL